jgi:hypothetical protein
MFNELPQPGTLSICPNCRRPWATVSHNPVSSHDYGKEIIDFMGMFLGIRKITTKEFGMGFSLTLEIKNAQQTKE